MMIDKIHINSFGKLKDFDISLGSGLNVLYGKNESGKSTLQTFIKGMFYTLSGGTTDISKNERKRYQPWDLSPMSGTLSLALDGEKLTIAKVFQATAGKDKISVTNDITGLQSEKIPPRQIGEAIFGFGEEAFANTMFVKQLGSFFSKSKDDELITKLINLTQTGNENVSYKRACDFIEAYRKPIVGTTRTKGEIELLGLKITEYLSELSRAKGLNDELSSVSANLGELTEKRKEQGKRLCDAQEQRSILRQTNLYNEFVAAKEELAKLSDMISQLKAQKLGLEELQNALLATLNFDMSKFTTDMEVKLLMNEKRISDIGALLANIEELKSELEELRTQERANPIIKKPSAIMPITAIVLSFIMLALAFIIRGTTGIIIGAAGFIPLIVAIVFFVSGLGKAGNKEDREQEEIVIVQKEKALELQNEAGLLSEKSQLEDYNKTVLEDAGCQSVGEYSQRSKEIISKKQAAFEYKTKIEAKDGEITRCSKEYSEKNDRFNESYPDKSMEKPASICRFSSEQEIDDEISSLNLLILNTEKEMKDNENTIKTGLMGSKPVAQIEEAIDRARAKIKELEQKEKASLITGEVLKQSFQELQRDFGPILNTRVEEIMSSISGGVYSSIRISEDYDLSFLSRDTNMFYDSKYLSAGALDMAYLSLRLGILNIVFKQSVPFLILDDSFVLYDDQRCEAAIDVLHKLAANCQIILLTCQKRDTILCKKYDDIKLINM